MTGALLPYLPEGLGEGAALFLLAISFVASFITAAFGIGGGGLLLAFMATLVPPAALIPVHGVIQVGSNAGRMLVLLGSVHWPALGGFLLGSIIGSVSGGFIVVDLPPAIVQIGVGLFVIWTVFARAPRWLRDLPVLTGAISSFLTMFFGATGLFVASYTKSFELPRHAHVATHAALMTLQHGLKVVVFGLFGFAFGDWIVFVALMIGFGLLGTLAGRRSLNLIDDVFFRRVLDALLILISIRLVIGGIASL